MALKSGRYGVTKKQYYFLKEQIKKKGGVSIGTTSGKVRSNKRNA